MKLSCRLGFHNFSIREIHVQEKIVPMKKEILAAIMHRCEYCREAKIPFWNSEDMKTRFIIPTQFGDSV